MSDFVLQITGAGEAITLEPMGCVDRQGAQTLLEALERAGRPADTAARDPHRWDHRLHGRRAELPRSQRPPRLGPRQLTDARGGAARAQLFGSRRDR